MPAKSQRQLQMGENIKRILANIFLRNDYSNIGGSIVAISEVDMSSDLKNAKIFVDIYGNKILVIEKLKKLVPAIRHQLAQQLTTRSLPELFFVVNKTQENAANIEKILTSQPTKPQIEE
jgi:ribosome-binding factor A